MVRRLRRDDRGGRLRGPGVGQFDRLEEWHRGAKTGAHALDLVIALALALGEKPRESLLLLALPVLCVGP